MFNGIIDSGNSYGYYITVSGQSIFKATPPADADWTEGLCYIGIQVYANSRYAGGNTRPNVQTNFGGATFVNSTTVSNGNYWIEVPGGQKLQYVEVRCPQTTGISSSFSQIAGFWRFDSQPVAGDFTSAAALTSDAVKTDLVFANGTDMSALEAGDEVTQTTTEPGPIYSNFGTFNNKDRMYDGDDSTFGQSPTLANDAIAYFLNPPPGRTLKILGQCTAGFARVRTQSNAGLLIDFLPGDGKVEKTFTDPGKDLGQMYIAAQSPSTSFRIFRLTLDDKVLIDNEPVEVEIKGTVDSTADTTVTLTEEVDGWETGVNVTGLRKLLLKRTLVNIWSLVKTRKLQTFEILHRILHIQRLTLRLVCLLHSPLLSLQVKRLTKNLEMELY